MTLEDARSVSNLYHLGHSVETIQYLTGFSLDFINLVIKGEK